MLKPRHRLLHERRVLMQIPVRVVEMGVSQIGGQRRQTALRLGACALALTEDSAGRRRWGKRPAQCHARRTSTAMVCRRWCKRGPVASEMPRNPSFRDSRRNERLKVECVILRTSGDKKNARAMRPAKNALR